MNRLILIALLSWFLAGCGGGQTVMNANVDSNANGATGNTLANANTATQNTNGNIAKVPNNSPTRISFGKGQSWATTNVTLPAGGSQKFVVTAKSGQMMDVEASSKETSVNLVKGKAQTTEDFGYLNAELQSNGDFIFEVRNSTKKEIKTSVKVTIEGGKEGVKDPKNKNTESEIDESDSTVMDNEDALPPPSETHKKKGIDENE